MPRPHPLTRERVWWLSWLCWGSKCYAMQEIGLHQKYVIIDCSTIDTANLGEPRMGLIVTRPFSSWEGQVCRLRGIKDWVQGFWGSIMAKFESILWREEPSSNFLLLHVAPPFLFTVTSFPVTPSCTKHDSVGVYTCIHSHTVTAIWVPCCLVRVCHWIVEHLRERMQYIIICLIIWLLSIWDWVMETIRSLWTATARRSG